jgi:hypothetical protein
VCGKCQDVENLQRYEYRQDDESIEEEGYRAPPRNSVKIGI